MLRLTTLVLSHRLVVALLWLCVAIAGGATAARTVDALSYDFSLPGQPAYMANSQIQQIYRSGGVNDPLVLTATAPGGYLGTPAGIAQFSAVAEQIAASAPGTRTATPANSGSAVLVAADGTQAVALLYPQTVPGPEPYAAALPAIEKAVAQAQVGAAPVQLTSTILLAENGGGDHRGILVEIVLGGLGAVLVLVLVFTSLLAGLPLLVAVVSILGTFLALFGLTALTDVSFVVQYLVALIGLGVAIDYSLLIVMRWREERADGADNDTAVRTAMATAGRAVLFSGVTVAVSLAALVAIPLPFLRSIGLGGLLIPLFSVATSLTLVPVVLHRFGPQLQWPRSQPRNPTSRRWAKLASGIVRRPWWVIGGTIVVLLAMTTPLLGLRLGSPAADTYGQGTAVGRAAAAITDAGLSPGLLRPTEVLSSASGASQLADRLGQISGVTAADIVNAPAWSLKNTTLVQVYFDSDPASPSGVATLNRVRQLATSMGAQVGGSPAEDADFVSAVYGNAPLVLAVIVIVTFLLLARELRSLWLPIKALALNVLSIGAAYGLTVAIWQHGIGAEAIFGIRATGALTPWVPVAVFAFLFGLSMDYEVFILSRMRESYDEHRDTPRAVVDGISSTARLVTSAALILFFAFITLSTVPVIDVKILATALALGIAIDALIVRALLAPALVAVLGHANWTMPTRLAKVLRVRSNSAQ